MGCITELEERLKRADFDFEYSDSHDVFLRGVRERDGLLASLKQIPINIATELINKHVPREHGHYYLWHMMSVKK